MPVTLSGPTVAPDEASSRKRRPLGTLVVTAVSPEERPPGPVAEVGGCRGVLTVGSCTVQATDGQLLGLAAWVLNAGAIEVKLSTVKDHSYRVELTAAFQSPTIERRRASNELSVRDEAWFLVRFAKTRYGAHHAATGPRAIVKDWERGDLVQALALVPERFRVNTRFPRVATWAPPGTSAPAPQPLLKATSGKPRGSGAVGKRSPRD